MCAVDSRTVVGGILQLLLVLLLIDQVTPLPLMSTAVFAFRTYQIQLGGGGGAKRFMVLTLQLSGQSNHHRYKHWQMSLKN